MSRRRHLALTVLIAVVAAAACGGRSDPLASLSDCLRNHHARVDTRITLIAKARPRSGWTIRRFLIGENGVTIIAARTDRDARNAYKRVATAFATVDGKGSFTVRESSTGGTYRRRAPAKCS